METVNTTMNITALVTCPNCDEIFDLFEMESLMDDGYIYEELLPNHECCPNCNNEMEVEIEWAASFTISKTKKESI
jgi:hypothetical protein